MRQEAVSVNLSSTHWFKLSDDIRIESVDKYTGSNVHPDRVMTQWVMVLMCSGERTFRIYDEDYAVHGNEFFILPANVQHYGIKKDLHQAYFSQFWTKGTEVSPPTKIDPDNILLPICGQIPIDLQCFAVMEYAVRHRTAPFYSEKFLASQIRAILYQLSLNMQKAALWSKQENLLAYRILKYIDDNKGRQLLEQDYVESFSKSYHRLNAIFQYVYGMTIKQMQINLRIDQAKRMLSSGHSIVETSLTCGFDDYLYFLKVFKRKTGMTPTEFQTTVSSLPGPLS